MFFGRTDVEAEAPILWQPDVKNSFEKTLILGKIEGKKGRGGQKMKWLDGINWKQMSLELLLDREA